MHSKKGFLTTQMFLYAFGAIIAVLIIYSGYKSISAFSSSAETSGFATLQAKFSSDLESLVLHKGQIKKFSYYVPAGYKMFCVFDTTNNTILRSVIFDIFPALERSVSDASENIFFLNDNKLFAFRVPELKILGYPYYSCQEIKGNQIIFSAKGAIYKGESVALMLVSNKAEVDITKPPYSLLPQSWCNSATPCILNNELSFLSSDGLAKITIPIGTRVTMLGTNKSLSIEIKTYGVDSEDYLFGPYGTTFSPSIQIGIKTADSDEICQTILTTPSQQRPYLRTTPPIYASSCDGDGFILFNVNNFNFN